MSHPSKKSRDLSVVPDPEVSAKAIRRQYTTEYKLEILGGGRLSQSRRDRRSPAEGGPVLLVAECLEAAARARPSWRADPSSRAEVEEA